MIPKGRNALIYETVKLWDKHPEATLTSYVLENTPELKYTPRRTVLVCPGGGYHFLSDREAEPIAVQFLQAGFNVFLLRYSVEPEAKDYAPLIEAALAMKYIRQNAEKYNVDPGKVFVSGFSAGGHLACSLGTLWNIPIVRDAIGVTSGEVPEGIDRPDGMILSYPVITAGEKTHKRSIRNVSGHAEPTEEDIEAFSLERHVDANTCPAFIWHTFTDATVPVENSLLLASAMAEHKIPFELHIFPEGKHGLSLCNEFTCSGKEDTINAHNECWVQLAINWIKDFK